MRKTRKLLYKDEPLKKSPLIGKFEFDNNSWLPFKENMQEFGRRMDERGDVLVKFDNDEIKNFSDEHPFAILTHFK